MVLSVVMLSSFSGAMHAMYFADRALICTNPELSSVPIRHYSPCTLIRVTARGVSVICNDIQVRDSDRMVGLVNSKSKRAVEGRPAVKQQLVTPLVQEGSEQGTCSE